eukprot:10383465-Lingulodinium_polyedra.AAC.1
MIEHFEDAPCQSTAEMFTPRPARLANDPLINAVATSCRRAGAIEPNDFFQNPHAVRRDP